MAKKDLLLELTQHYEMWDKDNEKRMSRKNGWNDVTDSYYGKLPDDWPYITKIVDPRIRTSLIEKNGRLLNNKLRGRLVPREGSDVLKAEFNNAILDYQWDTANDGGSMLVKMSIADMDTRLYQSKFALVYWKYEVDEDGKVKFDGNEMKLLDIRDCGMDPAATHVKDAKWFQYRSWEFLEDLETQTDTKGRPSFKNLKEIRRRIEEKLPNTSQKRDKEYTRRVKELRGLEDRVGEDIAFPVVQIVTEYRENRWITFSPEHKLILREIKNPYDHGKLPIAQLRYYHLQDDALGESEVEPVIPLWKAIQATLCSYMDEVILKMRPPLKIMENAARIETIEYGPEAQWLVDSPDAITEMESRGDSLRYFQTTYSALVSAFNVAMGDMSQGTSAIDPFETEKTATEVKATLKQQNTRDQKNQNDLAEFIKDVMMMWLSNNKQFLFTDPSKKELILKIVGSDKFSYFKRAGLDEMEVTAENARMVGDIVASAPELSDADVEELWETAKTPIHPVVTNPQEKDPSKLDIKPKMRLDDMEDTAELSIVPEDLEGTYDYVPDIKSMSSGADQELADARMRALELFTNNPNVLQLMQQEGYRPKIKELLRANLEEMGLNDAERFFEQINEQAVQQAQIAGNPQAMGGAQPPIQEQGLPGIPQANPQGGVPQQMAGPNKAQ